MTTINENGRDFQQQLKVNKKAIRNGRGQTAMVNTNGNHNPDLNLILTRTQLLVQSEGDPKPTVGC